MQKADVAKQIKVTINDSDVYEGWSFGERWNGWAVPYFEKDEADKVAKAHACKYNPIKDIYEFKDGNEIESFDNLTIETKDGSKKVYAIGANAWIWDDSAISRR